MNLKSSTTSIVKAAKMLGISPETCTKAVRRGQIPSLQIGNRKRIPLSAIRRLAAGKSVDESASQGVS